MKTLHLGIISILVILGTCITQTSNASQPLLDSYNNSDLVLVGKILSLSQVPTTTSSPSQQPNQTRYDIEVEQYYKNPQQSHLMTVYGYAKGIYLSQDPTYDVGDRVFLYLHNENGHYQIQSDSLKLDNNCDARGMIPMATLPFEPPAISSAAIGHSFYASDSEGNAQEFFLAGNNVTINFDEQNALPVVKDVTVELIVKTNNDTKIVMDDKKSVTVQACNGWIPMKWIFIPTMRGEYTVQVNVTADYNFGNRYVLSSEPVINTGFTVRENTGGPVIEKAQIASPLKQFKSGIAANDVKCREDLMLVIKTTDGSPACVKPLTYNKLALQGWAKLQGVTTTTYVTVGNSTYDIPYIMRGWTNKLLYITANTTQNTLTVFVESTAQKGEVTLTIPRELLDSKSAYSNQNTKFVILVDKQEVKYTETTSITSRTLTIPFDFGAKEIEIIATTGI